MKLKRIPRLSRFIFLTLMLICLSCSSHAQSPPPGNKKILILVGYQYGLPVPDAFTKNAIASLKAKGISADDIFIEYLDLLRNPQAEYRQKLAGLLHRKLDTYTLGVIVAFSAPSVHFLENEGRDLFPTVPLIINTGARTTEWKGQPRELHTMTSVMDFSGTLQYALTLLPKTQRVIVTLGRDHEGIAARAHESLVSYESKLTIEYTSELSYEEMLQRVAHAPADTIILNSSYFGDKTGRNFIPAEVSKKIAGNANAPVFVMYDNLVGNGVLGGSVLRSEAVATVLADLALKIMRDKQTSKLSDLISTPVVPMFDWTQMQRWGLDMDKLPPGALVLNRPVTLWGQYKEFVVAVVLALLLLSGLVLLLYGQNRLRRKAEILARESEERFRVLLEHAPEAVILLNIDQHKLIDANSQAKRFTERARQALLNLQLPGMTEHGVPESIDAEIKQALDGGEVMLEKYMNMDGEARYWEVRFVRLPAARQSLLRASFTNISERKQTQQALARLNDELEERVSLRTADLQKTMDQLHHSQEELLQSKKLAALGGMVAGVAHELNTPIGNCLLTTTTQSHDLQELERAMAHGLKRSALQAYIQNSTTALAITEKESAQGI